MSRRRRRLRFQNRVLTLVLLAAAPGWLAAAAALAAWDANPALRWTLFAAVTIATLWGAAAVQQQVVSPLRSLANMLEALREDDYSLRGRTVDPEDAVGEVMVEVNTLSQTLHHQRLEAVEAGVLLNKVIAEVDIAVFAFDAARRLRLVNRAGEALLGGCSLDLLGRGAADLGLAPMLVAPSGRIVSHHFPGGAGRWEIRRRSFREGGRPHELLVISDVSRALREEERQAWRRIVRVIGHELNSSLTPIKSTAATLRKLVEREPPPPDWRDDARAGLTIIHDRADALGRFMGAYARLARLPPPARRRVHLAPLVRRVAALHGGQVAIEDCADVELDVDADQLEQVLINLTKNAVEAVGDGGGVRVRWRSDGERLTIEIEDDGPGLARTDNLWVPFFTTKPGGTGIGLVLSREIVENHGGTISLENRAGAHGCVARVALPLD
ncbi:MAG: PAS domain-containing sensor histidine kinase [Gammaproteobacteria bacterium]|nr:PAS domain-containing sensor histidine kinase [Gammaproteobacteria bacterium]